MNTIALEKGLAFGVNMTPGVFWKSYYKNYPLVLNFFINDEGKEKEYRNCIIEEMSEPKGGVAKVVISFREYGTRHCDDPVKWKGDFDFNTNVGYPSGMDKWPVFFQD